MQQGSEDISKTDQHVTELATSLAVQQRRVIALKEVASLCVSMQHMALYCIDQNHVTVDHMEVFADTLGILHRQAEALRFEIASH